MWTADPAALRSSNLRSLLDGLGIERASLVGQSLGGRSVLGFAAAYPERVEALVLGGYRDADLDGARAAAPDIGRVVDAGV